MPPPLKSAPGSDQGNKKVTPVKTQVSIKIHVKNCNLKENLFFLRYN